MELTLHVNDKLKIYSKTYISDYHSQVVNLLYQPIVGIETCNLYFTLWNFFNIEKNELTLSHRQLLTFFNWDITKFIKYRNKLEAIGLLNVFYNNIEGYYLYELRQPLTAKQFFQDSNLNVHLLYVVGDNMYDYLERKFVVKNLDKTLMNITKPFEELYQILQDIPNMPSERQYVTSDFTKFSIPINYDFDFELLTILLNRHLFNNALDEVAKQTILQVAALYQFDAQMMSRIIVECIVNDQVDLNRLHEVAKAYYKHLNVKTNNVELNPSMTEKQFYEFINKKPQHLTNKEKALRSYKTKTPHEWLKILQNNTEVPSKSLDVIKILYDEYKFNSEVINVLIEFIFIRNDGRLPAEYAKTVASTWAYKKIKTAEEAMAEVDKIKNAENEFSKRGQVAPTYTKPKRTVETPDWLKDHQEHRKNIVDVDEEPANVDELKKLLESFK
ncbi:MAG: Replication initiation and rane attachment protein [Haloplasmataceae bacterium]|nr:Replication initiation and rane attachment protein [Haloplasmataceae bacterium]